MKELKRKRNKEKKLWKKEQIRENEDKIGENMREK